MKKSLALVLIVLAITGLSGCNLSLNHYEDKLYSEKIFTGYAENSISQDSNVFTREKAIEKAVAVFDKGLNVKIDRTKLTESVRLFRDSMEDSFKWNIRWFEPNTKTNYDCIIDSSNGDVLSINEYKYSQSSIEKFNFSIDEAKNIITPLLTELNININDYQLSNDSKTPGKSFKLQYASLTFYNIGDRNKGFNITVDYKSKKVTSYLKFKLSEKYNQYRD